jgi:hypothetical protein
VVAALAAAAALSACAADPESDALGSCTLNCAQPKVGSSSFQVQPFGATQHEIICGDDPQNRRFYPLNGPVRVQFQIYKTEENFGPWDTGENSAGSGLVGVRRLQDGGGGGGGESSGEPPILPRIPRAGIGFEPLLTGLMSVENTNDEFKTDDTTASSFKFAGVVTPSSEWCSDSCGIMTYEFWPMCSTTDTNTIDASVLVHGSQPPTAIDVEVTASGG